MNQGFSSNFQPGNVWSNGNQESVRGFIINRVRDDFNQYGIQVETDRGYIKAYIGRNNPNDYLGWAETGIGSYNDINTTVNDNPDILTGEIALVFMERCFEKMKQWIG